MRKTILAFCCIITTLAFTGCKGNDYKKAVSLYENGDYQSAYEKFEKLDDYKDSAEYKKKCKHELGIELFNSGDYLSAYDVFYSLADYWDCPEYCVKCLYSIQHDRNNRAKYVYTSVATACTKMDMSNHPIPEGIYKIDLSITQDSFPEDSSKVEEAIQFCYNEYPPQDIFNESGYAIVKINTANCPSQVFWCEKDIFGSTYDYYFLGTEDMLYDWSNDFGKFGGYPIEITY